MMMRSYRYLRIWKGEQEALNWLSQKIPVNARNHAAMLIYGEKMNHILLWTLVEQPEAGPYPEVVWLFRAAAAKQSAGIMQTYSDSLNAYYNKASHANHYHLMGRILMGLEPEQSAINLMGNAQVRCELAYFMAVLELSKGDIVRAHDWLRVSIETGLIQNKEYQLAFGMLSNWRNSGMSLTRISKGEYSHGHPD